MRIPVLVIQRIFFEFVRLECVCLELKRFCCEFVRLERVFFERIFFERVCLERCVRYMERCCERGNCGQGCWD